MGHLNRRLRCVFTPPYSPPIKEVPQISSQGCLLSVQQPKLRADHGPSSLHLTKVKLLALKQDIRLYQYLDNWLIRATSKAECEKHTTNLLSQVWTLGFVVNLPKSELTPQQRFDFIGYRFCWIRVLSLAHRRQMEQN